MGYVNLLKQNFDLRFNHYFLNINHRSSNFDETTSPFQVKFAFEPGVNFLFEEEEYSKLGILPYMKFGPEMSLIKNMFIGVSAGLVGSVYYDYFVPLPFWGVNSFYLSPVSEHLNIEFEFGFHSSFFFSEPTYLMYFTVGISAL